MESGKIWRWKCADKADHFGNIEDPGILCTANIDFPFSLQPTIYTLSIQSDQGTRDFSATSSRDIVCLFIHLWKNVTEFGWNPFLEIKLHFLLVILCVGYIHLMLQSLKRSIFCRLSLLSIFKTLSRFAVMLVIHAVINNRWLCPHGHQTIINITINKLFLF